MSRNCLHSIEVRIDSNKPKRDAENEIPGPGAYLDTINGIDAKAWKVLSSENLRKHVEVVISHKKLLDAGFLQFGVNK